MVGLGTRFAIERAKIGNSRPKVARAWALLDLMEMIGPTRSIPDEPESTATRRGRASDPPNTGMEGKEVFRHLPETKRQSCLPITIQWYGYLPISLLGSSCGEGKL